jgi:hypothetical protein
MRLSFVDGSGFANEKYRTQSVASYRYMNGLFFSLPNVRKGEPGKEGPEGDQTRRRKDRPELRKRVHPHQVLPASGQTITVFRYVGACI